MSLDAALAALVRDAVADAVRPLVEALAGAKSAPADGYATISDEARRLDVHPKHLARLVRGWEAAGTIKPLRVGRAVRLRSADVDRALAASATATAGDLAGDMLARARRAGGGR